MPAAETFSSERYGPWALICGASEGVGEAFARRLAAAQINVVLVSRRRSVLEPLARDIEASTGAQTRVVEQDLGATDAAARLLEATADLEIGMVIFNAGSDDRGKPFLDLPAEHSLSFVRRGVVTPLELSHHLGAKMCDRGRGGMIFVSSGAGRCGGSLVVYSAAKAFDRTLGEGLWWELGKSGVDVLTLVLGPTATPALQRLLDKIGKEPIGAADPDDVARIGLEQLQHGPVYTFEERVAAEDPTWSAAFRREAVETSSRLSDAFFAAVPGEGPVMRT